MPQAASRPIADLVPMNARILSLDLDPTLDPTVAQDAEAIDRRIDHMLCSLFGEDPEENPLCGGYYCTGYWPADMESSHATPPS